jgi:hypothetical protein
MVFLHSGARDFDLGGGFQHSGNYPMVFLHSGARDFDLGGGFQHSGNYPMVFLHSGARDFDLGGGFQHSGNYPMVFLHSGARNFDLGGGFQHSGNYPMVFLHSAPSPSRTLGLRSPCLSVIVSSRRHSAARMPRVSSVGGRFDAAFRVCRLSRAWSRVTDRTGFPSRAVTSDIKSAVKTATRTQFLGGSALLLAPLPDNRLVRSDVATRNSQHGSCAQHTNQRTVPVTGSVSDRLLIYAGLIQA